MRTKRIITICAWVLLGLASLPVISSAQDPRRTDPGGIPTPEPIAGEFFWNMVTIPGLAPSATLATLWADTGELYVWSVRYQTSMRAESEPRQTDPGIVPDPPDPGLREVFSTLYRWDGTTWTTPLEVQGEIAGTVYGVGKEVFATTNLPGAKVKAYHFDGKCWHEEQLPAGVQGPAGDLAGKRNDIYFRTGASVLRYKHGDWEVVYSNEDLRGGHGLTYLDRAEVYVPGRFGQAAWNGKTWTHEFFGEGSEFHDVWGARDHHGELHMFATGSDLENRGRTLYQFVEGKTPVLTGVYETVLHEHGAPNSGHANVMWGCGVHDIVAAGDCMGVGSVYQFNGVEWIDVTPFADLSPAAGIGGTPDGEVWLSMANGRLLHRSAPATKIRLRKVRHDTEELASETAGRVLSAVSALRAPGGSVTLEFALSSGRDVSVAVFDLLGRRVATLERGYKPAGSYRIQWAPAGVESGVYFAQVRAGDCVTSKRISVIH